MEGLLSFPVALVSILVSLPLLAFTFGVAFVAAWFVFTDITALAYWLFSAKIQFTVPLYLSVASCFLLLLFIIAVQINPEFLRDYPRIRWPLAQSTRRYRPQEEPMLRLRDWFSDESLNLVLAGPRCALFAIASIRRGTRLLFFDVKTCAAVLAQLVEQGRRVPFTDLGRVTPKILSRRILVQLHDIQGVVFLTEDPLGLTLTAELRAEIFAACRGKVPRFARPTVNQTYEPPPEPEPEPYDELAECYRVLGVPSSASVREIKSAYRKQLKNCHPDHFHDFGDDWRVMAAQKTRDLIEAYEKIMADRVGAAA